MNKLAKGATAWALCGAAAVLIFGCSKEPQGDINGPANASDATEDPKTSPGQAASTASGIAPTPDTPTSNETGTTMNATGGGTATVDRPRTSGLAETTAGADGSKDKSAAPLPITLPPAARAPGATTSD